MKYVVSSSVVKYNYCKNEATEADEMHTRITNSFGGRGTLVVNKVWHDVKAAVAKRPDITFELWRVSNGAQPQHVSGDYKWDLTINDWFWQCTFGKQNFDRFDENGFEYQYYVVEKLVTQNSGYVASYYNGDKQPNALKKNPASAQEVFDETGGMDAAAYAAFVPASAPAARWVRRIPADRAPS